MRDIFASIRARVFDNPRSTLLGLLLATVLLLLWLGADAIQAVTAEVDALSGLAEALTKGWQALLGLPVVLWLLGKRDA